MHAFDETGARCSKQRNAIEAGFKEFHVWKRAADRGERPPVNSLRQAGVSLNRAVSEGCADGLVIYRLANIHRRLGDCVTAMQIFHSAENDLIANYSEHYQNYLFQGMGKCSESSVEAALYYQRALNANPDDIGSRINMAYRMMNAGQLNESFAVLKELLDNRRDSLLTPSDVHHGRAQQILEQRQRTLQDAWAHNPERFVHGPPKPQALPKAVWINPPTEAKTSPDAH